MTILEGQSTGREQEDYPPAADSHTHVPFRFPPASGQPKRVPPAPFCRPLQQANTTHASKIHVSLKPPFKKSPDSHRTVTCSTHSHGAPFPLLYRLSRRFLQARCVKACRSLHLCAGSSPFEYIVNHRDLRCCASRFERASGAHTRRMQRPLRSQSDVFSNPHKHFRVFADASFRYCFWYPHLSITL